MTLRIYDIPHTQVTDWWSLVSPVLERAVKQNPHMDMPGLLQMLLAQFAQLVVVLHGESLAAVVVMERHVYPNHVVGNILFLAGAKGAYKHISDVVPHLEKWANEHGCDRIAMLGRPGLSRLVKRHGGRSIQLVHAWRDL